MHHYCSAPGGDALTFGETDWYELLASADRMDVAHHSASGR